MREIKFRAWDEKEKCWVSGFAIHQSGMFSDWAGCKKINGQCVADADWKYQHEIPHIKIMQYTGLRDKNGKEIYEGDIVRFFFFDNVKELISPVEQVVECGTGHYIRLQGRGYFSLNPTVIDRNYVEVIGNIYEHPHLLKGDENA